MFLSLLFKNQTSLHFRTNFPYCDIQVRVNKNKTRYLKILQWSSFSKKFRGGSRTNIAYLPPSLTCRKMGSGGGATPFLNYIWIKLYSMLRFIYEVMQPPAEVLCLPSCNKFIYSSIASKYNGWCSRQCLMVKNSSKFGVSKFVRVVVSTDGVLNDLQNISKRPS